MRRSLGREAQRRELRERLAAVGARMAGGPLPVDAITITWHLERMEDVLKQDSARVNTFLRQHFARIDCVPVELEGRRFYRAAAAVNGGEMIKSLGLAQAFDFGGCGGRI
jgi:hypothetical protein